MKKVLRLAWRNVWRSKLRSLVVIGSILIGMWAGIVVMGLSVGMNNNRVESMVDTYISHIQVHQKDYRKERVIELTIDHPEYVINKLKQNNTVVSYCQRTVIDGTIAVASGVYGVAINGINPNEEAQVTNIHDKIVKGTYFEGIDKNPIVIGEKLANKMGVDIKNKVVLTFQNKEGDIITGLFKVAGIFKTSATAFDEASLFIRSKDLSKILEAEVPVHEIAVIINDYHIAEQVADTLNSQWPNTDYLAESWNQVTPELNYANETMESSLFIFIGIIILALALGILNTMLMAILERQRELGVLMAVGMNKRKIFFMVIWETVFFALIGGPLGMLAGSGLIQYWNKNGLDLSIVGDGLERLGIPSVIYPELATYYYLMIAIMVIAFSILAAVYPAFKALQLKPVEAIRSV